MHRVRLAVDGAGRADEGGAEGDAERLVAEADAEEGQAPSSATATHERSPECRVAGPGADDHVGRASQGRVRRAG